MNLSAYGRGHRALSRLSEGPATMSEIREAVGVKGSSQGKKLYFMVGMLVTRGIITHTPGFGYDITDDGLKVLAKLSTGQDVTLRDGEANARIFSSSQRAGRAEQASRRAA